MNSNNTIHSDDQNTDARNFFIVIHLYQKMELTVVYCFFIPHIPGFDYLVSFLFYSKRKLESEKKEKIITRVILSLLYECIYSFEYVSLL